MRRYITVIVLLLFIFLNFSVTAQQKTDKNKSNGLSTVTFDTPNGKVTVKLPEKIHAGDVISGTVVAEPKGKNQKQKQKNKNILNGYVIEIDKDKKPVTNKIIIWKIPDMLNGGLTELVLKDSKGNILDKVIIPFDEKPETPSTPETLSEPHFSIPAYLRMGEPERISGPFDGDFSNSTIKINKVDVKILAESPDELLFETLAGNTGSVRIEIIEKDIRYSGETNLIDLKLGAGKLNLSKGEQTLLNVEVLGLQGIESSVPLHIVNLTPGKIIFEGGDMQDIEIQPGEANNGIFSTTRAITAKMAGGFSIEAAIPPCQEVTIPKNIREPLENDELFSIPVSGGMKNGIEYQLVEIPVNNIQTRMNPDGFEQYEYQELASEIDFQINVEIPDTEKQKLRNKGRKIPGSTPLGSRDPDDRDKPYSRPVPPGIRTPPYEKPSPTWNDPRALLDKAKERVKEAKAHKGDITTGVPGYRKSGTLSPGKTIPHKSRKCTEYVYNLSLMYLYVNDRTLILEEQLSPSHEFFIANGIKKIDITKNETGWSVSPSVGTSAGPVDISITGKYWQTKTRITGTEKSSLEGRTLWLFHIGRLYLWRRAYVRIDFEYHYEVCDDGTTRNWVNVTYSDNWVYWYEWEEEVFAASKDDEGNFHREESFPNSMHSEVLEKNSNSYEVNGLEQEEFEDCGPFFPKVTNK